MQRVEAASTAMELPAASTQEYEENIQWLAAFLGSGDFAESSRSAQVDAQYIDTQTPDTVSEQNTTPLLHDSAQQAERETTAESSTAHATPTAALDAIDDEMRSLLDMRADMGDVINANDALVKELREGIHAARGAAEEVSGLEGLLQRADGFAAEDSAITSVPVNTTEVQLPKYPSIYEQIPLFASQAGEVEQLQALTTKIPWTAAEQSALHNSVLQECRRLMTHKLASEGGALDLASHLATMSDEQLLLMSLPENETITPFDWTTVSVEVGRTHTPDECRTRWLMKERPGINKDEWDEGEVESLRSAVQEALERGRIVWGEVADALGTGRLAIDCLRAALKYGMLPERESLSSDARGRVPLTQQEQERIASLDAVWDNNSSNAAERPGTGQNKASTSEHSTSTRKKGSTPAESQRRSNSTKRAGSHQSDAPEEVQLVEEPWFPHDDDVLALAMKQLPRINGSVPWFAVSKRVGKSVASCQRRLEILEGAKRGAAGKAGGASSGQGKTKAGGSSTKRRKVAKQPQS